MNIAEWLVAAARLHPAAPALLEGSEVRADYATFARKDRNSDDWYLGAITDENARTLEAALDFLDPGRRYEAQIYRDGDHADDHGDARFDIVIEKKIVTAADRLSLRLAPGGGEAIRFKALR